MSDSRLWELHRAGAALFRSGASSSGRVSWLDVKRELAHRLSGPVCRLCARHCQADRRHGETGFCGLGNELRVVRLLQLWDEEVELGRPGLGVALAGCALRCRFCYRGDELAPAAGHPVDPAILAAALEKGDGALFDAQEPARRAAEKGLRPLFEAQHLHFLGGNPDESLPAILELLSRIERPLPVVWNSHGYLSPPAVELLEGVADAVVADLKIGPGRCGEAIAGVKGYWPAATAGLTRLAAMDLHLVVRHVALPGHLACCAEPAAGWARANLPGARVRILSQYQPLHAAAGDRDLGRRLSSAERDQVGRLGDDPAKGRESR